MKNNIDIKEIWNNQEVFEPNLNEFLKSINDFKRKNLKNIFIANVLLILTSIFIVFIWIYFQPKLITTKIGILTIILAMIIYMIALSKTITLNKENFNMDNNQYLAQLINLKTKQKFMQVIMIKIYFLLLSLGLCLYLIEYVQQMSLILSITVYSITLFWIALNWFYFRPKITKKQNVKLNDLIDKLKNINNQID